MLAGGQQPQLEIQESHPDMQYAGIQSLPLPTNEWRAGSNLHLACHLSTRPIWTLDQTGEALQSGLAIMRTATTTHAHHHWTMTATSWCLLPAHVKVLAQP